MDGQTTPKTEAPIGEQAAIPSRLEDLPGDQRTPEMDQMLKAKAGYPNEPLDATADVFRQQPQQQQAPQQQSQSVGKTKEWEEDQVVPFDMAWSTEQAIESVRDNLASIARRGERVDGATLRQMIAQERGSFGVPQEMSAQFVRDVVSGITGGQNAQDYFSSLNKSIDKLTNLSMMRASEITLGMTSGNVTAEDLEKLRTIDPEKYQEVVTMKNEAESSRSANQAITWEKEDPKNHINSTGVDQATNDAGLDTVTADSMLGGKSERVALYESFVNNDEIKGLTKEARKYQDELADLEDQAENLKADIQGEFGTALSKSALNALINDRMEDISREVQTKTDKYNNILNQINTLKEDGMTKFGIVMQEMKELEDRERRQAEFDWQREQGMFSMQMMMKEYWMKLDQNERNKQKLLIQRNREKEDREYLRSLDVESQMMSMLEWSQSIDLVSKMRQLENQAWTKANFYVDDKWDFIIFDRNNPSNTLWSYTPLSPEQKEVKDNMISFAESNIGAEYIRGSEGEIIGENWKAWYDCSWLLVWYGRQIGLLSESERPTSSTMYNKANKKELENLSSWDLIFYREEWGGITHVGISYWPKNEKWEITIVDSSWGRWVQKRTIKVDEDNVLTVWNKRREILWGSNFLIDKAKSLKETAAENRPSVSDVATFNATSPKDLKLDDPNVARKYENFINEKNRVFSDPNSNVEEIIYYSRWQKNLTDSQWQKIIDAGQILSSLDEGMGIVQRNAWELWPIIGTLRWINPWDTDAKQLQAILQPLATKIARTNYWEVWVMTDTDMKRYSQVLPSIQNTDELNTALFAMQLRLVMRTYEENMRHYAWMGRDVSNMYGNYLRVKTQVEDLESGFLPDSEQDNVENDPYSLYYSGGATSWQTSSDFLDKYDLP